MAHSQGSRLADNWCRAAEILEIDVISPYEVTLPSGARVEADAFVKGFGAREGMLLLNDPQQVERQVPALEREGYGVAEIKVEGSKGAFDLEQFATRLRHWGYCGNPTSEPSWLVSS
jgi:hypothetical protein